MRASIWVAALFAIAFSVVIGVGYSYAQDSDLSTSQPSTVEQEKETSSENQPQDKKTEDIINEKTEEISSADENAEEEDPTESPSSEPTVSEPTVSEPTVQEDEKADEKVDEKTDETPSDSDSDEEGDTPQETPSEDEPLSQDEFQVRTSKVQADDKPRTQRQVTGTVDIIELELSSVTQSPARSRGVRVDRNAGFVSNTGFTSVSTAGYTLVDTRQECVTIANNPSDSVKLGSTSSSVITDAHITLTIATESGNGKNACIGVQGTIASGASSIVNIFVSTSLTNIDRTEPTITATVTSTTDTQLSVALSATDAEISNAPNANGISAIQYKLVDAQNKCSVNSEYADVSGLSGSVTDGTRTATKVVDRGSSVQYLCVRSIDQAGNVGAGLGTGVVSITVPTFIGTDTPPTVTIARIIDPTEVIATISATDVEVPGDSTLNGIKSISVKVVDTLASCNVDSGFTALTGLSGDIDSGSRVATHTITRHVTATQYLCARATDKQDNVSPVVTAEIPDTTTTGGITDSTPPRITARGTVDTASVSVAITATDNIGVESVESVVSTTDVCSTQTGYTVVAGLTGAAGDTPRSATQSVTRTASVQYLCVKATDARNNQAFASAEIQELGAGGVDTELPVISLTRTTGTNSVSVAITATDNIGVESIESVVSTTDVCSTQTGYTTVAGLTGATGDTPRSATQSVTRTTSVQYLCVKAADARNNQAFASAEIPELGAGGVDTELPVISLTRTTGTDDVSVAITATDNIGVESVESVVSTTDVCSTQTGYTAVAGLTGATGDSPRSATQSVTRTSSVQYLCIKVTDARNNQAFASSEIPEKDDGGGGGGGGGSDGRTVSGPTHGGGGGGNDRKKPKTRSSSGGGGGGGIPVIPVDTTVCYKTVYKIGSTDVVEITTPTYNWASAPILPEQGGVDQTYRYGYNWHSAPTVPGDRVVSVDVEVDCLTETPTVPTPQGEIDFRGTFKRFINSGTTGYDVEVLQTLLKLEGCGTSVTGHFGDQTIEALKQCQKSHSLPQTGLFDKNTAETFYGLIEKYDLIDENGLMRPQYEYPTSGDSQPTTDDDSTTGSVNGDTSSPVDAPSSENQMSDGGGEEMEGIYSRFVNWILNRF